MITDQVLARLNGSGPDARGLPNHAFVSNTFLDLEREHLFPRSWVFAAPVSSLGSAGDVRCVDVAGHPLILVKGEDERVRAFHNVCPHRGARLVTKDADRLVTLTCPYHAWSYQLDGRLKGRPHYHGPLAHDVAGDSEVSLFEVKTGVWHDWLFVNINGQAMPFEDYIAPVISEFEGYDVGVFERSDLEMTFEFRCNWKLAFENFCDFYHVFKLHPALDEMMANDAASRRAMWPNGPHIFNGYQFTGAGGGIALGEKTAELPSAENLSGKNANSLVYTGLFPNAAIVVLPSSLQVVLFEPVAVDRTIMRMWFYFVGDAATSTEQAANRRQLFDEWFALNKEDESICARLQQGRACTAYDGGRIAPYWDTGTLHFHRQVVHAVRGEGYFAATPASL